MKKRAFLTALAMAGGVALPGAQGGPRNGRGPALLTLTGAVGKTNRARFDPALDQMMHKQKIDFARAYAFDFAALTSLPAHEIRPTLEYDGKAHTLRGPALLDVLQAAGAMPAGHASLVLRAVDGYAATLTVAQARARRFLIATHLDGEPMALGGLGPLWAMYDADRVPEMAVRPLAERFGACPWALYHIEIAA